MGFDVNESVALMEYGEDLNDFLDELVDVEKQKTLYRKLELVEVYSACMQIGSKKGNRQFKKYTQRLRSELRELLEKKKEKTIWDALKEKEGKQNTFFDALKRINNGL